MASVISLHLTICKAWIRRTTKLDRRRSLTGIGPMFNVTSRQSKVTGKAPSGVSLPGSSSPTPPLKPLDLQSDSMLTLKNRSNILTSSVGTGTKAGIFPIYPSVLRYLLKNSDQRREYRWFSVGSSQPLRSYYLTQAQIFAVKKNAESDKMDRTTLVDVGIRGESKMEMIDGQVYFSAIKFSSTTYNNEGVNFNLLIVLYIN